MGGVAVLLTALTVFDYAANSGSPKSSPTRPRPAHPAVEHAAPGSADPAPSAPHPPSAQGSWQEIRALSRLQENSPAVARRYQGLVVAYSEMVAEVAAMHGSDETPEQAAQRAIRSLLAPELEIKAMLVADNAVSQPGSTLLSVSLSLESSDSQAMQQAIIALGNPAAGLVWRELAVGADAENRRVKLTGIVSVLAIRYAE